MTPLEQSMLAQIEDFKKVEGVTPEAIKLMEGAEKLIRGETTLKEVVLQMAVDFPKGDSQQ